MSDNQQKHNDDDDRKKAAVRKQEAAQPAWRFAQIQTERPDQDPTMETTRRAMSKSQQPLIYRSAAVAVVPPGMHPVAKTPPDADVIRREDYRPNPPPAPRREKRSDLWHPTQLRPVPAFYPLEKSTRLVEFDSPELIAVRLTERLRTLSVCAVYDDKTATASFLTPENVEMFLSLWHTPNNSSQQGVLVEVQRRKGDSIAFHRYCRAILDAAVEGLPEDVMQQGHSVDDNIVYSKKVERLLSMELGNQGGLTNYHIGNERFLTMVEYTHYTLEDPQKEISVITRRNARFLKRYASDTPYDVQPRLSACLVANVPADSLSNTSVHSLFSTLPCDVVQKVLLPFVAPCCQHCNKEVVLLSPETKNVPENSAVYLQETTRLQSLESKPSSWLPWFFDNSDGDYVPDHIMWCTDEDLLGPFRYELHIRPIRRLEQLLAIDVVLCHSCAALQKDYHRSDEMDRIALARKAVAKAWLLEQEEKSKKLRMKKQGRPRHKKRSMQKVSIEKSDRHQRSKKCRGRRY